MAKPLVIVESPAKAKTLGRFLGNAYTVKASVGHVRDLPERSAEVPATIKDKPWGRMAVDPDDDFKPYYVVSTDKKRTMAELRQAVKDASEVLLATDPDREGESISWHLQEALKPKVPVSRIEFHEITEEAVREAIANARKVDMSLVDAQESRRILDRLYGYMLSPVLWKKVQTGLSAGRVQSVAVRLIVEREQERRAFVRSTYWDLDAVVAAAGARFTATLTRVGDQRVASGRDFDATTGTLTARSVRLLDGPTSTALATSLRTALPWRVASLDEKPTTQRPSPPFTTSTLQQEANRKLGFGADRAMSAAQRLFQDGVISYHRTDSTTLSDKALAESANAIRSMYGAPYYSGPRQYRTKVKNAQEAHEAIRPTDFHRLPQDVAEYGIDEQRIYELIWKRTVASQMADAKLLRTSVEIVAAGPDGVPCTFGASGKAIEFPGFLRAYVEGSDDPAAQLDDQESLLPGMKVGDLVGRPPADAALWVDTLEAKGHETQPPARYNDATLVKRLEDEGIGRPSTYASIIRTIVDRGYANRQGKALVPTFTAFAVTSLLKQHFGQLVELGYTAELEGQLDEISNGRSGRSEFLNKFYRGDGAHWPGLVHLVEADHVIDYPVVSLGVDPQTGQDVIVKVGRYGPYVQIDGQSASIPEDAAPADFTIEQARNLVRAKVEGPKSLGVDPATQLPVFVLNGRFGPYVQLGETPAPGVKEKPKRASLAKGMTEESVTLAEALQLLALPRLVGVHPDDGAKIVANFGRFGPYIKHNDEFRSLADDAQVFAITLDEAVELLRQPKRSRMRKAAEKTVLREMGAHPASGAAVKMFDGRYGPYVSDGTTNASVPKGVDPASLTLETAVTLLREREGVAPKKRPTRRGATGRGRKPA